MLWFSHRHSPSPPGGTQWYLLLLLVAYDLRRTPYSALSMGWLGSFVFCPWWPWPLTFALARDFSTVHLTAKFHRPMFNRSESIVRTNNKYTDKQTDTPLKTSTSLRYAPPVGKKYMWTVKQKT